MMYEIEIYMKKYSVDFRVVSESEGNDDDDDKRSFHALRSSERFR